MCVLLNDALPFCWSLKKIISKVSEEKHFTYVNTITSIYSSEGEDLYNICISKAVSFKKTLIVCRALLVLNKSKSAFY